ncbi:hypothetical protein E2C01_009950 [Portunus trituberculatus]|uniref:Uncharacterized protein n=1 Tax=Portunus trituberculatus TaxID=210409 RepID=A0A5B7D757_PORTR|nr:hypothetical protein [Portunus trituberculatus]
MRPVRAAGGMVPTAQVSCRTQPAGSFSKAASKICSMRGSSGSGPVWRRWRKGRKPPNDPPLGATAPGVEGEAGEQQASARREQHVVVDLHANTLGLGTRICHHHHHSRHPRQEHRYTHTHLGRTRPQNHETVSCAASNDWLAGWRRGERGGEREEKGKMAWQGCDNSVALRGTPKSEVCLTGECGG